MKATRAAFALAFIIGLPHILLAQTAIVDNLSSTTSGFVLVESPPSDQMVAQGFRTNGNSYQVTGGAVRVARSTSSAGTPYASIFTVDAAGLPGASLGELTVGPLATSFTAVPLQPLAPIRLAANKEYLLILGYTGVGSSYVWDLSAASVNVGAGPVTTRTLVRTSAFSWRAFSAGHDTLFRLDGVVVPELPTAGLLAIAMVALAVRRSANCDGAREHRFERAHADRWPTSLGRLPVRSRSSRHETSISHP